MRPTLFFILLAGAMALGAAPAEDGGVLIYRFTPAALTPWRDMKPLDLERRVDETRFAALLDAADRYVQSGAAPVLVSPARLEQMDFIRNDWVGGPNILIGEGLWAHGHADGTLKDSRSARCHHGNCFAYMVSDDGCDLK